ncbi:MAG: hypothetical protein M1834_009068 [Cirrosporium novae-zelandiae]|nr:MAG: hypothetical protein M1834_009068 [Cirrosporium novae-zelandiae]
MFDLVSSGSSASFSPLVPSTRNQSRPESPTKASTTQFFSNALEASTPNFDHQENTIIPPPAAITSYTPYEGGLTSINPDTSFPLRRSHHRTHTESFLDHCRLPPLITPRNNQPNPSPTRETFSFPFGPTQRDTSSPSFFGQPRRAPSPSKHQRSLTSTFTGLENGQITPGGVGSRLAGWFGGISAPVKLGVVPAQTQEQEEHDNNVSAESTTFNTMSRPFIGTQRKHVNTPAAERTSSTPPASTRFSFFTSKATRRASEIAPELQEDKYLNLDVKSALYPGPPSDPSSPASYKDLQQNAEALFSELQEAYKIKAIALHDSDAEKDALREELDEAELRAKSFKMQLDSISSNLLEQQKAMEEQKKVMENLTQELAAEKKRRREEARAKKTSIKVTKQSDEENNNSQEEAHGETPEGDEASSSRSKQYRRSYNSTYSTDSGFGSEDESSANSIFSLKTISTDITLPDPTPKSAGTQSPKEHALSRPSMPPPSRLSTFQRILSGGGNPSRESSQRRSGCSNCEGMQSSEAWSIVSILKEENKGLKQRVGQLEDDIDKSLDVVRGFEKVI